MFSRFYTVMLLAAVSLMPQPVLAQVAPGAPVQTATIQGMVTDSRGRPVADAVVHLVGPSSGQTTSNAQGEFTFSNVTLGTYSIYVDSKYGSASKNDIVVNGDVNVAVNYLAPVGLKTIAHVSTSGGVTINVTPASIAALSPSNYAFQGVTSWRQILEQIPGVAATGNTYGGGDTNDVIPNGPFQPVILSINGAQPYESATLLDGMPITNISFSATPGAGTDLGTMPLNAFDSAAVIRGPGADSPTILDSVGGSFLFHAPSPVTQNQYELSYADDPWGGFSSNSKVAVHLGRLSADFSFGAWDSPGPIHGGEVDAGGFFEMWKINNQVINCPATSLQSSWLSYGCLTYRNPPKIQPFYSAWQNGGFFCCFNDSTAWDTRSGSGAVSYRFGQAVTASVFYMGAMNRALQTGWIYPVTLAAPAPGYTGAITANGPVHDFVDELYNSPEIESDSALEEKVQADIGQGILQVAALQNNSYGVQELGFNNAGMFRAYGEACLATGGTASALCPAGTGLVVFNGQSVFAQSLVAAYGTYNWRSRTNNRDLSARYDTQIGSATRVGVSFVKSYYNYTYGVVDQEPAVAPGYVYSSGEPDSDSETSREYRVYVSQEFSDKFSANLSWYFTSGDYHVPDPHFVQSLFHPGHYTDAFYPYSAPRLSFVWRPSTNIAVRAAAGGGYALQSLLYLLGSNGSPSCTGTMCSVTLTNVNLKPEKSYGMDLGTDVRIGANTAVSVDLYQTNLFGMFFESGSIQGTYHGFPLLVTQYRNLPEARMQGVDFSFEHNVPRGIFWHGAFGLTRGYLVSAPAGFYNAGGVCKPFAGWVGGFTQGDTFCTNTEIVPGINFTGAGYTESAIPYANGFGSIGYRFTPQTYVELEGDYFGKNNSYYQPPFVALNGFVGYGLTRNVTLLANFQNITCVHCQSYEVFPNGYPTVIAPASQGQLPYGLDQLPYGPRTVILTVNFRY